MKKIKSEIHSIFPTPVYMTFLERKFSLKEEKFIKNCDRKKNTGNFDSVDKYILENEVFINLKKEILDIVQDYYDKVLCTSNSIKPHITQSWLNFTGEKQFHHVHEHPNSYISGVLYIDVDENEDRIYFYKSKYESIKPEVKEYNLHNSTSWFFNIKKYQVILFPSYLTHSVETKVSNNIRTSLAFNTFFTGTMGSYEEITELKI